MGGKVCIKGTRITIGTILIQISERLSVDELLAEYPHLTKDDVAEALHYAGMKDVNAVRLSKLLR